jgi:hypothetical protein
MSDIAPNKPAVAAPKGGVLIETQPGDFLPIPKRSLNSSGEVKVKKFRVSGGRAGRTFILRESLDAWIDSAA